jgi:hypothetical protein
MTEEQFILWSALSGILVGLFAARSEMNRGSFTSLLIFTIIFNTVLYYLVGRN